jgi:peptide deformylase
MLGLKIATYGNPVLREKAKPIEKIDESIRKLAARMIVTMHKAEGIGLAAPQVGKSVSLFVVDTSPLEEGAQPMVFINVEILEREGSGPYNEGCLSIPGVVEEVIRPTRVRLRYTDLGGVRREGIAEGILARVIQHETDHLNGVLFIDYLSQEKLAPFKPVLEKLKKKNEQSAKAKRVLKRVK